MDIAKVFDEPVTVAPLVVYALNDAMLAMAADVCKDLSADTPKGYEEVRLAIAGLRTNRVEVEARRKFLKKDALEYGRAVDDEAKRLTAAITAIEEPLLQKKHDVDYEKAEVLRKKREAAQIEIDRAAKVRQDEQEERLRLERVQLEDDRKVLEAQQSEALKVQQEEQARLAEVARKDEERRQAELSALALEREELRVERELLAESQRLREEELADQERVRKDDVAHAARVQKLLDERPDIDIAHAFVAEIRGLQVPAMLSDTGARTMANAFVELEVVATRLEMAIEAWD